jgi:hypothetical protein
MIMMFVRRSEEFEGRRSAPWSFDDNDGMAG